MERGKAQHHIRTMARVLDVSPAGFYARRVRPRSLRSFANEILGDIIARIHTESRGTYGAPRVQAELRLAHDIRCSRKRIARIMRQQGRQGVSRRRLHRTTVRDATAAPAPDLVGRDFRVDAPNKLWVADITYISTLEGFLYLACVLDACSRRVVGWSMRTTLHTELVTSALDMALARQRPDPGLVHHSDRGCQYTSFVFGQRCKEAGIVPSMGSVGDAYDNAMAEAFFATLECELLDRKRFRTREEARTATFDFIETWYNPRRRHSALEYASPVEYERRWREPVSTSP